MYISFLKNLRYITPPNLNGTVRLFKQLGHPDKATEIIRHYLAERSDNKKVFDLDEYPFAGDIDDADVVAAFKEKFSELDNDNRGLPELLLELKHRWETKAIAKLAKASLDEYVRAFKEHSGSELRQMISGALAFDRTAGTSPEMKEVARLAREALRTIGRESKINACRVARYGVAMNPSEPAGNAAIEEAPMPADGAK